MTSFRFASSLAVLAAAAACAATSRPAPALATAGCFALEATDINGALFVATGLRALPPYVALDGTAMGVRGRRVLVPPTWQGVGPNPDWASWRVQGRTIVLSFVGSAGSLEVVLHPTPDGFSGESVTPLRNGLPPVLVTLTASTCVGLRPGGA
jgi:hypothetical protein